VKFVNNLPGGAGGNLFIPVDRTTPGAGVGPDGVAVYSDTRAAVHLHGGNTPWISDGTQHQWTASKTETTTATQDAVHFLKGWTVAYVPDMWFDASGNVIPACSNLTTCGVAGATNNPGPGALTFYWTNQQSGRLMFYHDHAYGITRLNVMVGEAAGYVLTNPPDEDALKAATVPGTLGTVPDLAHYIPIVIQDRTFVPPAAQLALEDPTWDSTKWGKEGDIWYPHVYTPNQWPQNPDNSAANPFGRWDYGPWFFPPMTSLNEVNSAGVVVPRPLFQNCTTAAAPGVFNCPTTPNPSAVPESFLDTMIVNGTAYPSLTVDPTAYRFQILNAANERNLNLSFFVADTTGTEVSMVPAVQHLLPGSVPPACAANAAVSPVTGLPAACWPLTWPTDGRLEGVPDPATAGPAIVQIGSEAGLLPSAVTIHANPTNYEYNRRNIVVLNVSDKSLFMGPAERADIVVDFSQYAGKTLILYNDSPAPVPAGDPRIDYYTGAYDQTSSGGSPAVHPGYGPNTRTIMQIKVNAGAPQGTFNPALASAAIAARFKASQLTPIVPEAGLTAAMGPATTYPNTYSQIADNTVTFTPVCQTMSSPTCAATGATTITFFQKAIQELFDLDYGRMNATLATELPTVNFTNQTTVPFANFDPPTEFITNNTPTIWKITHNGVDTHTVHFHLLNAQILNRVGWDGQVRPPDANELGWKESVRMHPLEDIFVALQPIRQNLPWPIPDQIRPLDVTRDLNLAGGNQFTKLDINNNPIAVTNQLQNYGWEYVWHCHLLGHEEADMLRMEIFVVPPEDPTGLTAVDLGSGNARLQFIDNSASAMTYTVVQANNVAFTSGTTLTFPAAAPQPAAKTINLSGLTSPPYFFKLRAEKSLSSVAIPGSVYTAASGWTGTAQLGPAPIAGISPTSLTFGTTTFPATSAAQTVTLSNTGSATLTSIAVSVAGANSADFARSGGTCGATLAAASSCTILVTFSPKGSGARSGSLLIASNDPTNPVLTPRVCS
jgi:FtsP/CotA-like multicopper oxidase with cupredoxin domain